MSEAGSATAKGPQVSARFKMEPGRRGVTSVASRWKSGRRAGVVRHRHREHPRAHHRRAGQCGLAPRGGRQFIENTEAGNYGRRRSPRASGSKVCSLTVEIDEYKGKEDQDSVDQRSRGWLREQGAERPEMKLDLNAPDEDGDNLPEGDGDDEAPWNRAE